MMDHGKYLLVAAVCMTAGAWAAPVDQEELSRLVAKLDKLHQVTATPHAMADSTAALCRLAFNTNIHEGTAAPAYCHVYVTADAKTPMTSGRGGYPQGAVIIKAKLKDEKTKDVILYTVMRKMEKGFDAKHGDWEYSVLDGPSKRVLARGKIDSCIRCHREYAATDYVTRAYIK